MKKQIRKEILSLRNCLTPEQIHSNSEIIMEKLLELDEIKNASSVFVYRSFRGEVDTNELIAALQAQNKDVAFPVTLGNKMLAAIPLTDQLILDRYGVQTPVKYTLLQHPDVIITPVVVCDLKCNRIGLGKGYYDRYFEQKQGLKIGICHDFQMLDSIPSNEWDIPLDIIITEKRVIYR